MPHRAAPKLQPCYRAELVNDDKHVYQIIHKFCHRRCSYKTKTLFHWQL